MIPHGSVALTAGAKLKALLVREYECADALLQIVRIEHDALQKRDIESLGNAAADKERLATELQQLVSGRRDFLKQVGIGAVGSEFELWLNQTQMQEVKTVWTALTKIVTQSRHQNRINGGILDSLRRYTQRAVEILHGLSSMESLYSPLGESQSILRTRYSTTV